MNDNEERVIIECHISYEPVMREKLKKIRTKVSKRFKQIWRSGVYGKGY